MPPTGSAPTATTPAVEDYLEQIHQLIETKGYARVVDIAGRLSVSQASVSNMVRRLDAEGLLVLEKYRGMVLTEAGEGIARRVVRRHEVLTRLLEQLGIDPELAYTDVEGMEHHMSGPTVRAIEALVAELDADPALARRVRRRAGRSAQ